MKYFDAHLQGEHGLLRSCLLNGVLGSLAIALTIALIGTLFAMLAVASGMMHGTRDGLIHQTILYIGLLETPGLLLFGVWACVGIYRSGLRNALNASNSKGRQIGGIIAVIFVWIVFFVVAIGGKHLIQNRLGAMHIPQDVFFLLITSLFFMCVIIWFLWSGKSEIRLGRWGPIFVYDRQENPEGYWLALGFYVVVALAMICGLHSELAACGFACRLSTLFGAV